MLFINNNGITDPRINLALEEYCLRTLDISNSYLLFYINEPSVIIGKHQNTLEEINHEIIRERGIHVVRRISGGGAVYHDLGNLNFSFITRYTQGRFNNYAEFLGPVVAALHELGVNASLSGRNDILVGERKISGNAQFTSRDRMFSHGTLLFDSKLEDVVAALNVKMEKIESKGIKSIRSRVANISEFLKDPMTVDQFRTTLLQSIFADTGEIRTHELTADDWKKVHELSAEKYQTWEWNYGLSPKFNVQKTKRFGIGEIDVRIDVAEGKVQSLKIYGDFFSQGEIGDLEKLLTGIRYERDEISNALGSIDIGEYFADVSHDEVVDLLY